MVVTGASHMVQPQIKSPDKKISCQLPVVDQPIKAAPLARTSMMHGISFDDAIVSSDDIWYIR